jgi:DNA ligase (NAD+)
MWSSVTVALCRLLPTGNGLRDQISERALRRHSWQGRGAARLLSRGSGHPSRRLARAFGSLESLRNASEDDISAVDNIGPKTAAAIAAFFAERRNRNFVDRLLAAGVAPQPVEITGSSFEGRHFSILRETERLGGRVTSSVSHAPDYLVFAGSPVSKLDDARRHWVKIIYGAAFRNLLGQGY